jgi:N-acetylglucosamine-6-phosphate deacetylase
MQRSEKSVKNSLAIKNGRALLATGEMRLCDVGIQAGRIQELGPSLRGDIQIDAAGATVVPGLIDLHTHGTQTESASGDLVEYARLEAALGATTFYPTLFFAPEENVRQMRRHLSETDELRRVPQVGGFRLESPYLAVVSGGSLDALAPIEAGTTQMLLDAGSGHIKIWDVSPELPGAPQFIRRVSQEGIVCSLAHTEATRAQGRAAVDAGARLATHLYDVFFYTPERSDPDPDIYAPTLVDYLLIEDRIVCEIIGDGTHVDPMLVEKAFRCKGPDRLAFVTDSNYGAGLPPGEYDLPGGWGRIKIGNRNDGVRLIERDLMLAGSALAPIDSFRNVVRLFGKDIATASYVCSRTPARLMGLNKGEIAVGRDADIIILDEELELLYTIVAGDVVYQLAS